MGRKLGYKFPQNIRRLGAYCQSIFFHYHYQRSYNHYHFTNANTGDANDVWVSTRDGRIVKWTAAKSVLELH